MYFIPHKTAIRYAAIQCREATLDFETKILETGEERATVLHIGREKKNHNNL